MSFGSPRNLVLVIAFVGVLYLLGNARVSLWDRDEPRYVQTSRQMLETGDWVVPRFLDKVRTAKPVFIYWCQAASMRVIGSDGDRGVFAARLPSVVAMLAVLAVLAVTIRRHVSPAHAFWTVFILATSVLTVWAAKSALTDAVLLLGITAAQLCLHAAWQGRATWPVVIGMAVAIAIAGLTKGPVVLGVMAMTLLALGGLRLLDRRRGIPPGEREPRGASVIGTLAKVVVGVLIVAALVGPWLLLVRQRASQFLGTAVGHDVLNRIVQPLEGHSGPPGYHLALVFATFFPWSLLLPMAIVFGFKHRADPRVRFALAAVIGPWVMFEVVRTKLPHYLLPAFPALAFLAADAIVRGLRGEHDDLRRRAFVVASAIVGVAMVAIGAGAVVLALRYDDPIVPPILVLAVTVAFAVVVFRLFSHRRVVAGLLALGVGAALVDAALFTAYLPHAHALRTSPRVAEILLQHGVTAPGSVVMMDYKEPSLAYYQGGTIREERAVTLSHELLDGSPPWLVITDEVWAKAAPDLRERVEVVGAVRGVAYADGREVSVMVIRRRPADILPH